MSAYILSDLHHSTIARYINAYSELYIDCEELANRLKRINIASVNCRYNEKTKNSKCKFTFDNVTKYTESDIIRLINCWVYQSSEDAGNLDYIIMRGFLHSHFTESQIMAAENDSIVWSI
jgi:hypothetical protein